MDSLTPEQRSERMSRVRSKGSKAELRVRKLVHGLGFRYRLHDKRLPGSPDLVFRPRRKVIFVHGCFWHRHPEPTCRLARLPKSRLNFWLPKLDANRRRDIENQAKLEQEGWSVLNLWECEIGDDTFLANRIESFLTP